jgi:excisionase family DNA binding protein
MAHMSLLVHFNDLSTQGTIMTNKNKFLSIPKAAEKFGVDRRTMWRWVKSHKIQSLVTPGGHHRILCSEIEALLEQNSISKNNHGAETIILIVDDDESVCRTLKKSLSRKNFKVETALDGFKAGLKVRDLKPRLVILDLMMEGIDGFEVSRTIKADSSLKDTKILILTGFDTPENRERALEEGADAYLPKGGSFKNLLEQINTLLIDHG